MTRRGAAWLLTAILLGSGGAAQPAWAQSRSAIVGTIRDATGAALAGVDVTVQNLDVPGPPRGTTTNKRGAYRIADLSHGTYELTASLQGHPAVKRTGLSIPMGATLTLDLMLASPDARGPAPPRDAGPMIDVTTPASSTRLSKEDLHNLPLASGAAMLQLVPGVTPRAAFGSPSDPNEIRADGGAINLIGRQVFQTSTAAFDPYWMDEAQIVGPGAGAEFGEFTGVYANIAIRSGTDRFTGQAEYRLSPSSWVGDNTAGLVERLRDDLRPEEILSRWDTSGQVGGPVDRGRLYFFSGFHYSRNKVRQAGSIPLPDGTEVPLDEHSPAFLTKVTWVPSRTFRMDGFIQADALRAIGRLGTDALPETANDQTTSMRSWNARATWLWGPNTTLDFQGSGVTYDFRGISDARRAGPPPHDDDFTGILSGNVETFQERFSRRTLASATLMKFLDGAAGGGHLLRIGFELERSAHQRAEGHPGGQSFTDVNGVPTEVELWDGDNVASTGGRATLFFQDTWSAGHGLTIQPGVRINVYRGSVPDQGVVFRTHPASLRLGVAWDARSDHRTVVRASYGRLHERLTPTTYDFMNTTGRTPKITAMVLESGQFHETNRTTPDGYVGVDDDLAHAYVDQVVAGIERELVRDLAVTVQYVFRTAGHVWAMIDTGSQYASTERRDPGPDAEFGTADDGGVITVQNLVNQGQSFSLLSNPDGASRRYDAVQAIGQKRFSHNWQLLAAYTWSTTRGNLGVVSHQITATQGDTGQAGIFFNPNRRINADGPVQSDYTHQLNLQGVYQLPAWDGVTFSAGLAYLSGGPAGRTASITPLTQGRQTIRVEPRGTTRLDAARVVDLRVEKTFRLGQSTRRVSMYVDVLNVTNGGVALAMAVNEQSGARYLEPTSWAPPRTVRIAGRFKF